MLNQSLLVTSVRANENGGTKAAVFLDRVLTCDVRPTFSGGGTSRPRQPVQHRTAKA